MDDDGATRIIMNYTICGSDARLGETFKMFVRVLKHTDLSGNFGCSYDLVFFVKTFSQIFEIKSRGLIFDLKN